MTDAKENLEPLATAMGVTVEQLERLSPLKRDMVRRRWRRGQDVRHEELGGELVPVFASDGPSVEHRSAKAAVAQAREAELEARCKALMECTYCDFVYQHGRTATEVEAHEVVCPHSPLRQATARCKALEVEIQSARLEADVFARPDLPLNSVVADMWEDIWSHRDQAKTAECLADAEKARADAAEAALAKWKRHDEELQRYRPNGGDPKDVSSRNYWIGVANFAEETMGKQYGELSAALAQLVTLCREALELADKALKRWRSGQPMNSEGVDLAAQRAIDAALAATDPKEPKI